MANRSIVLALTLAACASSSSGSPPPTPAVLMLAVSTDLQIPGDLDVLEVQVDAAGSTPFLRTYAVPGEGKVPGTLALVTKSNTKDPPPGTLSPGVAPIGDDGTYTITVRARHGATLVVTRSAKLDLAGSFAKKLAMPLEKACLSVACPDGQSCNAGVCATNEVSFASLPAL